MNNIGQIRNCFGCGVCAVVCGKKIINVHLNADGFYEPCIKEINACTNCGMCLEVCSFSHDNLSLFDSSIRSYVGWSNDEKTRKKCSSGGVAYEFGKWVLNNGGKVCGVRYNVSKNIVEHYVSSSEEELKETIGSKYIQSYTVDGFIDFIDKIKRCRKYGVETLFLISGTPCQIDSIRRYARMFKIEDNILFLDFFCHGVPSKLIWDKYLFWAKQKTGSITRVSWRNKFTGWHDSWAMELIGDKGHIKSWLSSGDLFYNLFLSDTCLGKHCYEKCRFKYNQSSADIRIGDAWDNTFNENDDGISSIITFTSKGENLIKQSACTIRPIDFNIVAGKQMKENPSQNIWNNIVMCRVKNTSTTIVDIYNIIEIKNKLDTLKRRLANPIRSIQKLISK